MSTASAPIDISPPIRVSSASPRASNLTNALREASSTSPIHNHHDNNVQAAQPINPKPPMPSRQDSLGYGIGSPGPGAAPISMGKPRKESGPGSYMGGMSWGGLSVGSIVQDDVMMTGTSPYGFQSPSLHSSSYLPKMEANFWNNLRCCDTGFADLHELLQHFEEVHKESASNFPYRMSVPNGTALPRRRSSNTLGANVMAGNSGQSRGFGGFQGNLTPRMQAQKSALSQMQDLETLGEMEMDDDQLQQPGQGLQGFAARPDGFPQDSAAPVNPLDTNIRNEPPTPKATNIPLAQNNNPMVSSVNTPAIGLQNLQQQQRQLGSLNGGGLASPSDAGDGLDTSEMDMDGTQAMSNLQLNNFEFGNGNEMLDLCINEPAKSLFNSEGGINSQQYPQFSFMSGQNGSNAQDTSQQSQSEQLAASRSKVVGEEDRPFKCPVIGCEKAYKNANGLRYHEKHGHSTQKLKRNEDGTFSIVDPVTSLPYPGTVGMEKEKPYRCQVCGKRYKNLNGLKYHRNHSPPCNPDFNFNNVALPGMQQEMGSEFMG